MEELARIVLLVLGVTLLLNLAQRGPQGVRDWLAAKFLGRENPAALRVPRPAYRGAGRRQTPLRARQPSRREIKRDPFPYWGLR